MNVNVNSGNIDIALIVLVVFFIVPFFGLFVFRIVSNRRNIQGGLFNTLIIFIPVSFQAVLLSCIEKKRKYKFEFNLTDEKNNFD